MTIKVSGFPGLPAWLDIPKIIRFAKYYGVTNKEAKELLHAEPKAYDNIKEKEEDIGSITERDRVPVDRGALSTEPREAS